MGKSKEEIEKEKLQKETEAKANNKFLDFVIIQMIVGVTFFTLLWTIMNAFNLTIQTEVIVGYISIWGAEGGASCLIQLKKNRNKKKQTDYEIYDGRSGNAKTMNRTEETIYGDSEKLNDVPPNTEESERKGRGL